MIKLLMRISVLLACVLTTFGMSCYAESHYQPHISVGGHAGVAVSRMSFSPEIPQGWFIGPTLGVHANYTEEKLFGLYAELNFSQRGWKENFESNPELSYSRSLMYISLPVMTHIYFGTPRVKGFFNLGPEIGIMVADNISSNFDYKNAAQYLPSTRRVDQMTMDIKNRFDYGITAGLGAEYFVNPRNSVSFELRFYYGLGNIFPSSKADVFGASRPMTLSATVGYSFRLQ